MKIGVETKYIAMLLEGLWRVKMRMGRVLEAVSEVLLELPC